MANVWLNYVSEKMIRIYKTKNRGGKEFASISIKCPQSKTGFATLAVNLNQIFDTKRKDGSVVKGYKNIFLGKEDENRNVSIAVGNRSTYYKEILMTNREIVGAFVEDSKDYSKPKKNVCLDNTSEKMIHINEEVLMANNEPEEDFLRVSDFIKDEDIEPEEDVFKEDVWLDYIPENDICISKTAEGKEYANVVINFFLSKTGMTVLVVNPEQVIDVTRKDGSIVEGYKNVLLGAEDETRKISVSYLGSIRDGLPHSRKLLMTNSDIAKAVTEAHKEAHMAYIKAKAKAEAEMKAKIEYANKYNDGYIGEE
jgi:hypothetical protein